MSDATVQERPAAAQRLLEVSDVSVRFGGIVALDGVSFGVDAGQIVGLIGPNGAGKTTLFNCLSRLYECDGGSISFDGQPLLSNPRHRMAALGIGRTFQNVALFAKMSVLDNVMVGGHCRPRPASSPTRCACRASPRSRADGRAGARAGPLRRPRCGRRHAGAALPFPMQKRVELARALASEPKLLLLDEPAAGLNHDEVGTPSAA